MSENINRYFLIGISHPRGNTSITVKIINGFPNRINTAKNVISSLEYKASINEICILSIYEFTSIDDFNDYNSIFKD